MSKVGTVAIPLIAAAACLVLLAWLDTKVLVDAQHNQAASFDPTQLTTVWSLVSMALAGAILLLALLAWRSRSGVVAVIYVIVGAFLAFLPDIMWRFAASINGALPIIPAPLSRWIGDLYFYAGGPIHAGITLGGAMLLIGLALGAAWVSGRRRSIPSEQARVAPTT